MKLTRTFYKQRHLIQLCGIIFIFFATANSYSQAINPAIKNNITQAILTARPDLQISNILPTPVSGIYEVTINGSGLAYATEDGKHLFVGELFALSSGNLINLTQNKQDVARKAQLDRVDLNTMIRFSPKVSIKSYITVFTDVDCGYCRKLHKEVSALNQMGIEVRYLAYPRAGIGSSAYKKIASAWCSKNSQDALTKLKNGESIEVNVCDHNPVDKHFELGGNLGITGTPAMILPNGKLIPGYLPAERIAEKLSIN